MSCTLSIENASSLASGDPVTMALREHGLVIGRAAHADWTLPDPRNHISSLHAEIDYVDGRYVLTDRSTNGTFVNGAAQRLTAPYALRHGDLLTIGPYEVRVSLVEGAAAGAGFGGAAGAAAGVGLDWMGAAGGASKAADPERFGREPARPLFQSAADPLMGSWAPPSAASPFMPPSAAQAAFAPAAPAGDPFGLGGSGAAQPAAPAPVDPFGLAGVPTAPAAGPAPPAPFAAAADPFGVVAPPVAPAADPFGIAPAAQPPAPSAAPVPDVWAKLHQFDAIDFASAASQPVAPLAAPAAPVAVQPSASDAALFERFLNGAGLKAKDVGDAPGGVMEAAGRLLRQTADGLIRLLDARARIRHQFGVGAQVTSFAATGNNPLKWTRSPEQALRQLVGEPDPGFLPGAQAVQGAFEDLQAHEVAMIAAMQEALAATVERFSPDAIKARAQARAGLLPGSREAALWRTFETEYRAMAAESEAAYLDLFARHFRKAYERNIRKDG